MRLGAFLVLSLILTGVAGQAARADLVTNGNFATGDFTGWVTSDSSIVIDTFYTPPYNSDVYDAAFTGTGILSQVLATTAGMGYTLSFSVLDDSPFFLDTFTVTLGGFSAVVYGSDASSYTMETFNVPGSDILGGDTLSFQGSALFGDWHLDDVSLVPTVAPEPPAGAILVGAVLMVLSLRRRGRSA